MSGPDEWLKELRRSWTEATVELVNAREAEQQLLDRRLPVVDPSEPKADASGPALRIEDIQETQQEHQAAAKRIQEAEQRLVECKRAYFDALQESGSTSPQS